jgi:hypothetical protein
MSSISMWPPGAMQSTEAELGNNSKMTATTAPTLLLNRPANSLTSRCISATRSQHDKECHCHGQGKSKVPFEVRRCIAILALSAPRQVETKPYSCTELRKRAMLRRLAAGPQFAASQGGTQAPHSKGAAHRIGTRRAPGRIRVLFFRLLPTKFTNDVSLGICTR